MLMDISSLDGIETLSIQTGVASLSDRFTITQVGQSFADVDNFTGSILGFDFSFKNAIPGETTSNNGTIYTIQGRPDLDDFLLANVEFSTGSYMMWSAYVINLTAKEICTIIGVDASGITDFRPLGVGSLDNKTGIFKVKEKSKKALLDKLFGWTSEFGDRQIYYTNRNGVVAVNEVRKYMTVYDLDDATKYKVENTNAQFPQIRKFMDVNYDENSDPVKTPGHTTITPNFNNKPFSGTIEFGDSTITYVDGLITRESSADSETTYIFEVASSFSFDNAKQVLKSKTVKNGDSKQSTTTYEYDVVRHGNGTSNVDLDVSLVSEHTVNKTLKNGSWAIDSQHKTYHTPLGNGFFGQRVEEIDGNNRTTVATSISNGNNGGLASLYTVQQGNGYTINNDPARPPVKDFPGELKYPVNIPVADIDTVNELIDVFSSMDKKIEETRSFSVMIKPGADLVDAVKGALIYKGNLYYIQTTSAEISRDGTKQQITAVRRYAK